MAGSPASRASTKAAPAGATRAPSAVYEGGYSRQQVESGQKELVFISWLTNPTAFWVQKAGCEGELAALLESAKEVSVIVGLG